ncbi:MAG: hypothetical protein V3S93_06615 [Methyloceanibacter sp.]
MRQRDERAPEIAEKAVCRATGRHFSTEEKNRIGNGSGRVRKNGREPAED